MQGRDKGTLTLLDDFVLGQERKTIDIELTKMYIRLEQGEKDVIS